MSIELFELEHNLFCLTKWQVLELIALSAIAGVIIVFGCMWLFWRTLTWLSDQQD